MLTLVNQFTLLLVCATSGLDTLWQTHVGEAKHIQTEQSPEAEIILS